MRAVSWSKLHSIALIVALALCQGCDLGTQAPLAPGDTTEDDGDSSPADVDTSDATDSADEGDTQQRDLEGIPPQYDSADPLRGARLYDRWFKEVGLAAPLTPQPLYPPTGPLARYAGDTWRCPTCHGWDYRGVDGVNATGPRYTGVKGLVALSDPRPRAIYFALAGDIENHDFLRQTDLTGGDLWDMVRFLREGLLDASTILDADRRFLGDPAAGAVVFEALCVSCHASDGTGFAFSRFGEVLGTTAREEPWRVAHRIHFGAAGEPDMPRGVDESWTLQDVANLGAYMQTLPTSLADVADAARGGRLYDRWWEANGAEPPVDDNPLYPADGAIVGAGPQTWACAECHGFDYLGVDGQYATGPHYSGAPGVRAYRDEEPRRLYAALTGSVANHNLLAWGLANEDVWDLVQFVRVGTIDTSNFIDPASGAFTVNTADGMADYTADCVSCHAVDGRAIDLGGGAGLADVTLADPWRVLHQVRVGRPSYEGPAYFAPDTADRAAHVASYLTALPTQ